MPKKVKSVKGVIQQVTEVKPKEFKKKADGKPFTIFSIGIKLDNDEWYNVKANTEKKALEVMKKLDSEEMFSENDSVELFLEAEDKEQKYWKIISITELAKEGVQEGLEAPIEDIEEEQAETPKKPVKSPEKPSKEPQKTPVKAPVKDLKKVNDFKSAESDKYELGMAKNNASIICAALITVAGVNGKFSVDVWSDVAENLYIEGKKLRKRILGY